MGLAFILPSFLMVLGLSWLYVAYGGLSWMQALFYGIGAVVIAIIAVAAYRLARSTNKRDPLLWGIFVVLMLATVVSQTEIAILFLVGGLVAVLIRAWPGPKGAAAITAACAAGAAAIWVISTFLLGAGALASSENVLVQIFVLFTKAGAFVFGSGLAIVPFLRTPSGGLTAAPALGATAGGMGGRSSRPPCRVTRRSTSGPRSSDTKPDGRLRERRNDVLHARRSDQRIVVTRRGGFDGRSFSSTALAITCSALSAIAAVHSVG